MKLVLRTRVINLVPVRDEEGQLLGWRRSWPLRRQATVSAVESGAVLFFPTHRTTCKRRPCRCGAGALLRELASADGTALVERVRPPHGVRPC